MLWIATHFGVSFFEGTPFLVALKGNQKENHHFGYPKKTPIFRCYRTINRSILESTHSCDCEEVERELCRKRQQGIDAGWLRGPLALVSLHQVA